MRKDLNPLADKKPYKNKKKFFFFKKPSKMFGGFIFLYYICSVRIKTIKN